MTTKKTNTKTQKLNVSKAVKTPVSLFDDILGGDDIVNKTMVTIKGVVSGEDRQVEVREPTIKIQKIIQDKCQPNYDEDGFDMNDKNLLGIWGVIYCCFNPDTGQPIFDDSSYDMLTSKQTRSLVGTLVSAVKTYVTMSEDDLKALKNLFAAMGLNE